MVKVIWTARSLNDLEDIGEYISKDSPKYAKLTLEKLIDNTKLIEHNLLIGRIVPEVKQKDFREIITGNYRIIYPTMKGEYALQDCYRTIQLLRKNKASVCN